MVLVWGGLAGLFVVDPWPYRKPYAEAALVSRQMIDAATVRTPTLNPVVSIAGFSYQCAECHGLFPSRPESDRLLFQHRHIVLDHGINKRCLNCHNLEDRNTFSANRTQTLPYDQPQLLCAKCHGPVYQDWLHGVHGRTNGFWDRSRGPLDRRQCTECHDPHAPAFASMAPAPGPNTLRMGDQNREPLQHGESGNPLSIYSQRMEPSTTHSGPDH